MQQQQIAGYQIIKLLGKGSFAKVYLAKHKLTNENVAIKILQKSKNSSSLDSKILKQVQIIKNIRHPYIIQVYQVFQNQLKVYIIMQYVSNGQLLQHIIKKNKLSQYESCYFFQQIIVALQHLSKINVVHRDLKLQNILLDQNWNIRIIDFGLSTYSTKYSSLKTRCGSPCYSSPEMISGHCYNGLSSDIWSTGIIFYSMICGFLPFQDQSVNQLYKTIFQAKYQIPNHVSFQARILLQGMLKVDPVKRFSLNQIKNSAFWKKNNCRKIQSIIIGIHQIPVDQNMILKVKEYGFDITNLKKDIENNKYNKAICCYNILLKKTIRQNICSNADIYSQDFVPKKIIKDFEIRTRSSHQKSVDKDKYINLNNSVLKTQFNRKFFRKKTSVTKKQKLNTTNPFKIIQINNHFIQKESKIFQKRKNLQNILCVKINQFNKTKFPNNIQKISSIRKKRANSIIIQTNNRQLNQKQLNTIYYK